MSISELLKMIAKGMRGRVEDCADSLGEFMCAQGQAFVHVAYAIVSVIGIVLVHWWYTPLNYLRCYRADCKDASKWIRRTRAGQMDYHVLFQWRHVLPRRAAEYPNARIYPVLLKAVERSIRLRKYRNGPAH